MKRNTNLLLNIIIFSLIGQFIGSGLYKYWHFRKYPDLYVVQSAPWYTSLLINGLFTLILLAVCLIGKVLLTEKIRWKKKIALILGILFLVFTFIGGEYVLINHGQVNAGYAVIPGTWTMICFAYVRGGKQN